MDPPSGYAGDLWRNNRPLSSTKTESKNRSIPIIFHKGKVKGRACQLANHLRRCQVKGEVIVLPMRVVMCAIVFVYIFVPCDRLRTLCEFIYHRTDQPACFRQCHSTISYRWVNWLNVTYQLCSFFQPFYQSILWIRTTNCNVSVTIRCTTNHIVML